MTEATGKKTLDELRTEADAAADEKGMCTVIATIDGVRDNGQTHAKGDEFHMHQNIVPVHVAHGQVELAEAEPAKKPAKKQSTTPRDKQVTGRPNK